MNAANDDTLAVNRWRLVLGGDSEKSLGFGGSADSNARIHAVSGGSGLHPRRDADGI